MIGSKQSFFLISGHASLSSSADYPGNPWHHLQPSMIKMISAFRDGGGGGDDDVVEEEEGGGYKGLYLVKETSPCVLSLLPLL